ncbi:GNAT family N-acetyltransferase [bacterium]|nr:GNAT family N-acetyltransferase [bacterium]
MSSFDIRPTTPEDRSWIIPFITRHWGADHVVVHDTLYRPHELPGFAAIQKSMPAGLVTYHVSGKSCEIVTLDSEKPGEGIGSALIDSVMEACLKTGCKRIWLVTTNDNLSALGFYQKRGFVLAALRCNAVERSRRIKPSIPLTGSGGIPVRDEIELEMLLERHHSPTVL